jgi:DNA-binding transcriptional MerR regulator
MLCIKLLKNKNKKMLKIVKNVKNHISALLKSEDFIEIFDVNDDSVIFQISSIDQLVEGVQAQPDGDYLFSDGMRVVVSGGKVTKIEKPEPVVEPEPVAEPVAEAEPEQVVEPDEEPVAEQVSELQAKIAELQAKISELEQEISEKDKDIDEAKNCLVEVQNFYTKISSPNERTVNNEDQVKSIFKIKNK